MSYGLELELEELKKRYENMSKEELIDRLLGLEYIISRLGPQLRWVIDNFNMPVCCRWRSGRVATGLLIGAYVNIDSLILLADEEIRDYANKKVIVERHIVVAPMKALTGVDVILEKVKEEEMQTTW